MARLRFNAVEATLAAPLDDDDTTITFASKLTALDGDLPTISAPDYLVMRIDDEIIYVTAYTTGATTATISRGEEGTTAASHDNGSAVRHVPTADDFDAAGLPVDDDGWSEIGSSGDVQEAFDAVDTALGGKVAASTLTTDGDLLTRASGVPARITRADLAADPAFTETFVPLSAVSETAPVAPSEGDLWIQPGRDSLLVAGLDLGRVIAWDTFDRPDGGIGVADSGHTWVVSDYPATVVDGQAALPNVAQNFAVVDVGTADHDVEATVTFATNVGLVLRHDGGTSITTNTTYITARLNASTVALVKLTGGSFTVLASESLVTATGQRRRLRAVVHGDDIRVYVDGTLMVSHTLTGGDASTFVGTHAGIRGSLAPDARLDDFIVRAS